MQSAATISELIPKDKLDLTAANAAVEAGYPTVATILPELLTWLQDCNWPVAHVLAPFLASVGKPLVPHVAAVLETDDVVWKYWMISAIMRLSPEIAASFRSYLERVARHPTDDEARAELHFVAQEILDLHGC